MQYSFGAISLQPAFSTLRVRLNVLLVIIILYAVKDVQAGPHFVALRSESSNNCRVYSKPALHEALDRICSMCHEMFSHNRPNMRAECRSKCFRNEHFRGCLSVFAPGISVNMFGAAGHPGSG